VGRSYQVPSVTTSPVRDLRDRVVLAGGRLVDPRRDVEMIVVVGLPPCVRTYHVVRSEVSNAEVDDGLPLLDGPTLWNVAIVWSVSLRSRCETV
jgi:hypothetical protein